MSGLNRPDNFAGRVRYAADVIANGREARRAFDNCFENNDGDAVALAMLRRAATNAKLARNLWRYLSRATVEPLAELHKAERSLPALAKRMRERNR